MSNLKWSKDGKVSFQEEGHIYRMGDKVLTGVTSFINKFREKFDTERIASAYALKHDLVKEEVIAEWKKENHDSTDQGSYVHKVLEDYFLTGILDENILYPKQVHAVKFIKDFFFTGRLFPVEVELLVHNEVIASQIDLIARNAKGEFFIMDWKTNKKIDLYSYRERRMARPFSKYMDCNFYHYSLQVAIYKKLCTDYDIEKAYIVHFAEEEYKIYTPAPIEVPDWVLRAA